MQSTSQGPSSSLTLRVVLLDNRSERRQLMRRVVEAGHAGAVVVGEADTASETIAMVGEQQADVVIVEVQLPVDQGLRTIVELRAAYPDLGIAVCSFHFHADTQARARECGADDYAAKPITPAQLSKTLAGLASLPRHRGAPDPSPVL